jgi:HAD superfamily hydrolase (TIGR01509 family)
MDSARPQLVIFDCDGVLVDNERIAVRVDALVLGRLGWQLTEGEVAERFVGRSEAYMVEEIERYLGRRLEEGWDDEFAHLYRDAFERDVRAVDGIEEALDGIPLPMCVASSSSHDRIRYMLRLAGLEGHFEGRIFSATDVANGKPAPDLFLHAAERMGAAPAVCAVVEDSRWGVEAARAAGMRAFGYAGGLTPRERLEGPNTVVFEDMRELPRLLGLQP